MCRKKKERVKKNPPKQLLSCRIAAEAEETVKVENTDLKHFSGFSAGPSDIFRTTGTRAVQLWNSGISYKNTRWAGCWQLRDRTPARLALRRLVPSIACGITCEYSRKYGKTWMTFRVISLKKRSLKPWLMGRRHVCTSIGHQTYLVFTTRHHRVNSPQHLATLQTPLKALSWSREARPTGWVWFKEKKEKKGSQTRSSDN